MADKALLTVRELRVNFGPVRAVDGVSLTVSDGPFGIGLVGESGSGKTTIGRAILRLVPAAGGEILFDGQDVLGLRGRRLRDSRGMAILFVSHDLAVIAELCDRVAVMRAGEVVEQGVTREVIAAPRHEYTRELLAAVPKLDG